MARFTANFRSEVLGSLTHVEIIFPQASNKAEPAPIGGHAPTRVLYLLHGMYGGCVDWLENTRIVHYAHQHGYIVVCPEVGNSFYTDMTYGPNYFTYVAHELPALIEQTMNIKHTRENTFVAGLSMGGYGAMKIALSRPEFFTAVAAFSGALDAEYAFAVLPQQSDLLKKMAVAIVGHDMQVPPEGDLFKLAAQVATQTQKPRVLVTCGHEDFLIEGNRKFDAHMQGLPFDYQYKEWPGVHDWNFWEESLPLMFEFFGATEQ
ncbi:MAG: esterase family protein [Defluviitaleaceae bacterium]|nr:esterase family protein [Defluviitaleaceae bacterium]